MVLSAFVSFVLLTLLQAGGSLEIEIGLVPVVRATRPPVIDGQAEDAWSAAVERRLERSKGPAPGTGDVQGSFRAMWDDVALYLHVEVLDDQKVKNQANPWLDDSVEVYVDGDGSRGDGYDYRNDQGDSIGLDVHVNDNDGTGREDKLMWSDAADLAHGDPRRFGKAVLVPTAWVAPADATALTTTATDLAADAAREVPPLRLQYHDIRTYSAG